MGNDVLKIQSEICSKAPPLQKKNELLKKLPVGFKAVFIDKSPLASFHVSYFLGIPKLELTRVNGGT